MRTHRHISPWSYLTLDTIKQTNNNNFYNCYNGARVNIPGPCVTSLDLIGDGTARLLVLPVLGMDFFGTLLGSLVGVILLLPALIEDTFPRTAHHLLYSITRHTRASSLVCFRIIFVYTVSPAKVKIATKADRKRVVLGMFVERIKEDLVALKRDDLCTSSACIFMCGGVFPNLHDF